MHAGSLRPGGRIHRGPWPFPAGADRAQARGTEARGRCRSALSPRSGRT
jgi:hypothetical protein